MDFIWNVGKAIANIVIASAIFAGFWCLFTMAFGICYNLVVHEDRDAGLGLICIAMFPSMLATGVVIYRWYARRWNQRQNALKIEDIVH